MSARGQESTTNPTYITYLPILITFCHINEVNKCIFEYIYMILINSASASVPHSTAIILSFFLGEALN